MKKSFALMFLVTTFVATQSHADSLNLNLSCKSKDGWEVSVGTDPTTPYTFEVNGGLNHLSYKSFHFAGSLRHLEGGYIIGDADGDQFMYFNNEWSVKASAGGETINENLDCE